MANTAAPPTKTPLRVGSLMAEMFSIFFRKFVPVILLAFLPTIAGMGIRFFLAQQGIAGQSSGQVPGWWGIFANIMIESLPFLVIYNFITALIVQLAYDAKLRRPSRYVAYILSGLRSLIPITVLGVIIIAMIAAVCLAIFIPLVFSLGGLILLVLPVFVPCLLLYAMFSVMVPSVVIGGAGFRGLQASAALTKDYRWPIAGALVLLIVINIGVGLGLSFVAGQLALVSFWISFGIGVLVSAIIYSLSAILVALIYARLREIKEGVSVGEIVSVFE